MTFSTVNDLSANQGHVTEADIFRDSLILTMTWSAGGLSPFPVT